MGGAPGGAHRISPVPALPDPFPPTQHRAQHRAQHPEVQYLHAEPLDRVLEALPR